ncbi:hypothetical protein M5K25_005614 [Dendrobium thyrsiflorum]|uniref:Uncharacterized protein n=1 Tax=Dendrobium thyrsiflorum TaxID=117978 RepID=A0ABD0VJF8_DENTH
MAKLPATCGRRGPSEAPGRRDRRCNPRLVKQNVEKCRVASLGVTYLSFSFVLSARTVHASLPLCLVGKQALQD